jgi:hypothetical protein
MVTMNDTVTLVLSGEVTLRDFSIAISRFWGLLSALTSEVVPEAEIEWIIAELSVSSASATARALGTEDSVESTIQAFEQVGIALERSEDIPFSPKVRKEALGLIEIINEKIHSIIFETANLDAIVQRTPGIDTRKLEIPLEAYGSVEGRVQTLSSRGGLRFTLYDIHHDKAVSCYLMPGYEEIMRDAWGKLARVEGWIRRDPTSGRSLAVRKVKKVTVLSEGAKSDYRQARGVAPTASKETPEDLIRRLRDA